MSIKLMSAVWENGPEDKAELIVLLALADFANDAGDCWPAMPTIGKKARMSERNARRVIRKLEDDGYIKTVPGGGRYGCSQYRINPDKMSPGQNVPTGQNEQETRTKRAGNPDIAMSAEPSLTIKEPSKNNTGEAVAALAEVVGHDLAQAFVAHRKAGKSPLTTHAAQLIAKKLAAFPDPAAAIETSIINGWKGVFAERSTAPVAPRIRAQLPKEATQ